MILKLGRLDGRPVTRLEVIDTGAHTGPPVPFFDQASSTMLLGDLAGNIGGKLQRAPGAVLPDA